MSKNIGINKHCPGCCDPDEFIPVKEFRHDPSTLDGRARLCKGCEEDENDHSTRHEPVPAVAEKPALSEKLKRDALRVAVLPPKRRGCPKGGWPKKETLIEKMDIIEKVKKVYVEPEIPKPDFDLAGFEKISLERRISEKPMARFGKDNEIAFLMQAVKDFDLLNYNSVTAYIKDNGATATICFEIFKDNTGAVKLHNLPSYCYFNSVIIQRRINAVPGKYEITERGGRLFVDVRRATK